MTLNVPQIPACPKERSPQHVPHNPTNPTSDPTRRAIRANPCNPWTGSPPRAPRSLREEDTYVRKLAHIRIPSHTSSHAQSTVKSPSTAIRHFPFSIFNLFPRQSSSNPSQGPHSSRTNRARITIFGVLLRSGGTRRLRMFLRSWS